MSVQKCNKCNGTGKIKFQRISEFMPRWAPWEIEVCSRCLGKGEH